MTASTELACASASMRQRIAHVVATAAAPLLRNRDAEQASRGSLSHDLQRKCVSLVDLGRRAGDALGGKRPNLFLKRPLIVGQFESHGMNLLRFPRLVLCLTISGLSLQQGVQEFQDLLISCQAGAAKQSVASISKLSQPLDRRPGAQALSSAAKIGRRRAALSGSSSGNTRVVPTTVMKFVSPFQRGTTCRCT